MKALRHRYRVMREVPGRRAAAVFQCEDRILGGSVAVKTVGRDHDLAAELRNEGRRHEALRHPSLVPLVGRFEDVEGFDAQQVVGLATRWVEGADLVEWGHVHGDAERLQAIASLLRFLHWLHRRGWMHLDLKPDNVLVQDGEPVVLDLGSSLPVGAGERTAGGTLGYAAPEVVRGEAPDLTSDLFSVGVLAFELLAGTNPYPGSGSALRMALLAGRRLGLGAMRPDLDRTIIEAIEALLAPVSADRPASAEEALGALGFDMEGHTFTGELPLKGRSHEVERVVEILDHHESVALTGPRGLGRLRLAREALQRVPRAGGALCVDLTLSEDGVLPALGRLLALLNAPGLGRLDDPRLLDWASQTSAVSGVLLAGRRLEWSGRPEAAAVDALCRVLSERGLAVVVADDRPMPGLVTVALSRLSTPVLRDLVAQAGLGHRRDLLEELPGVHGRPGRLPTLARRLVEGSTVPDALRSSWVSLSLLPAPVRHDLILALPEELRSAWYEAAEAGLVGRDGGVWTFEHSPDPLETPTDASKEVGQTLIAIALRLEPPLSAGHVAIIAARAGLDAPALAWLGMQPPDAVGVSDVMEVARRLSARPEPPPLAVDFWVRARAAVGAPVEERLAIAERVPEAHPRGILARVLANPFREADLDRLEAWLDAHGDHPAVRGLLALRLVVLRRGQPEVVAKLRAWESDPHIDSAWAREYRGLPARVRAALSVARTAPDDPWVQKVVEHAEAWPERPRPAVLLQPLHSLHRLLGNTDGVVEVLRENVEAADLRSGPDVSSVARIALGGFLMDHNRSEEARRWLQEALDLAVQVGNGSSTCMLHAQLAEVEIGCRRLPAAHRHLRAFEDHRPALPDAHQATGGVRSRILWASYHSARGEPQRAIELLAEVPGIDDEGEMVRTWRAIELMEAYLALGAFQQALALAESLGRYDSPNVRRRVQLALGRCHLGIARGHLDRAARDLPEHPDPMIKATVGQTLLAVAGEDLDPSTFGRRRKQLQEATNYLSDAQRARAVALRERLLEGPGAALDHIVRLIESVGDGSAMLEILGQVVSEALGANRVLIMLRIPGLGRQVTSKEISGQESAGLAPEIWRRVRRPGDVWLAEDAFADPNLRRMSATVRTFQIKSVVAVAIPRGERVIGALYVDDVHRTGRFGPNDVAVLQRLAEAIGAVAEVLPARTPTDGLTVHDLHGLYTCDGQYASKVRSVLDRASASPQSNLLLTGPTGAGKTWLARRVATEALGLEGLIEVVLRPGPTDMLVSQLWGTQRGDFTGAIERKGAIFQAWDQHKALFLDELQNLDEVGQRVLLPLLELPRRRFGSLTSGVEDLTRPLHIVLGTNARVDLGEWARVFREDLWYRVSPVRIDLPPLGKRGREAVYRHLEDMLSNHGLPAPEDVIEREALQRITTAEWPGNLRSLADLAEQVARVYRTENRAVRSSELDNLGFGRPVSPEPTPGRRAGAPALLTAQARTVLEALERHDYVQSAAAKDLGLSKYALHRLLKKLELIDHVREQRNAGRRS